MNNPETTLNPLPIFIIIAVLVVIILFSGTRNKPSITITKMDFINKEKNGTIIGSYGTTFDSNALKYLAPRITYDSIGDIGEVVLDIKIIKPDGNVKRSESSPSGFSLNVALNVQSDKKGAIETLTGWGNETGGTYTPGTYTYEIWYKSKKLYATNFIITNTPPPQPIASPSNFRSSSVGTDRITLQWNSADSGLSYKIYYGTQNNITNAKTTTATGTSVTITGLTNNTSYYFWLSATKGNEESAKSSVLTVKTSTTPPPPPPANPLNGTSWEYINQNDSGNRYRLTFSGSSGVTFAIYNSNGSRQLESHNGTYWFQGNNLTVEIVYPNDPKTTDYYIYTPSSITNKQKQSTVYRKR
ncbi:hypothetical protein FACS1894163_04680 [Spirochaetia bacterium]|nr:hypothetical protein FACS1894163_04680 [Spirochaetia bacterium]